MASTCTSTSRVCRGASAPSRLSVRTPGTRSATVAAMLLFSVIPVSPLAAADTVTYRTGPEPASRVSSVTGTIVDYVGGRLTIRSDAGGQQILLAERIAEIQSDWTPAETTGDQLVREGSLVEAVRSYQQALRDEKRVWGQRQIVAKLSGCYGQMEQFDLAGEAFLRLLRSDPQTHYFHLIPLAWMPHSPTAGMQQRAAAWLANTRDSVSLLLGASWLLSLAPRAAAEQALLRLLTDRDPRVAMLAQAQLWRTRLATAAPDEIAGWEGWLTRLPGDLRAGPYYLIGQAWSAKGSPDKAALAFLRAPILYGTDRRLAAAALLSAGRELEKIGQVQEAAALYGEVVRDYAAAPAAVEARGRLEEMTGSPP